MTDEETLKEKYEEREFQTKLVRIQLKYDNINLVMTVVLSLIVSLLGVLAAIIYSGIFPPEISGLLNNAFIVSIIISILTSIVIASIGHLSQTREFDRLEEKYAGKRPKEKKRIKSKDK